MKAASILPSLLLGLALTGPPAAAQDRVSGGEDPEAVEHLPFGAGYEARLEFLRRLQSLPRPEPIERPSRPQRPQAPPRPGRETGPRR